MIHMLWRLGFYRAAQWLALSRRRRVEPVAWPFQGTRAEIERFVEQMSAVRFAVATVMPVCPGHVQVRLDVVDPPVRFRIRDAAVLDRVQRVLDELSLGVDVVEVV